MGLDITLNKVIPLGDKNPNDIENYYILEENPELNIFAHLAFEKTNSYFDLANDLLKRGYIMDELEYKGTAYGQDTVYDFQDKNHELSEANKWLQDIWHETYFLSQKELNASEYFKIFKEKYYQLLINYGWKPKYKFYASGNGVTYFNLVSAQQFVNKAIEVKLINPTTFDKVERCIAVQEVGYQRKGANKLFYDNNIWDSACVIDLKTLEEHNEKYFSPITRAMLLEKHLTNSVDSNQFKTNIIDKFVEGEMFVIYH